MVDRPATLSVPVPPEPSDILKAQAKQWHFRIQIASFLVVTILQSGEVHIGAVGRLTLLCMPAIQFIAYQLAAWWRAPRADWNESQQLAYFAKKLQAKGYTVEKERRV